MGVGRVRCAELSGRAHTSHESQLVGKLQEQVEDRTKELAKANQDLARANRHVLNQSQAQLRHFGKFLRAPSSEDVS